MWQRVGFVAVAISFANGGSAAICPRGGWIGIGESLSGRCLASTILSPRPGFLIVARQGTDLLLQNSGFTVTAYCAQRVLNLSAVCPLPV